MSADTPRGTNDVWHRYAAETACFADLHARIHVWRVGLDHIDETIGGLLSADERDRADRFHQAEDRRRFVAARGVLRAILSDVLDEADDSNGERLRFGYGPAGKPFLVDAPGLHFNLSHSEDLALIAVTRSGEVGIDVERERQPADMDGIARVVFTEAERSALLGCPPETRAKVFYRIWTRKEALLKAMGAGLPAIDNLNSSSCAHAGHAWVLTALPHLDGYVAALARPRHAHGLKLWSWPNASNMRSHERRARSRLTMAAPPSSYPFEFRR